MLNSGLSTLTVHVNREECSLSPHFSVSPNPKVKFEILYEDDHFVALNKPSGVVTQPGTKHQYNTLLNAAFARWGKRLQNLGKKRDFGLLHRLDRGTSGIVLIALSADGYDGLRTLFESRTIKKRYWALVDGVLQPKSGRCDVPIAEQRVNGKKRALLATNRPKSHHTRSSTHSSYQSRDRSNAPRGQRAVTLYETLDSQRCSHGTSSFISCDLLTGRLHQIRVHMRSLGSSVLGDFDYAGKTQLNLLVKKLARDHLALHAGQISFQHPLSFEEMIIHALPPKWFTHLMLELNYTLPVEWETKGSITSSIL